MSNLEYNTIFHQRCSFMRKCNTIEFEGMVCKITDVKESGLTFMYPHFETIRIDVEICTPKSQEQTLAEESVEKAKAALQASQDVLNKLKEKQ